LCGQEYRAKAGGAAVKDSKTKTKSIRISFFLPETSVGFSLAGRNSSQTVGNFRPLRLFAFGADNVGRLAVFSVP
jgi:hypothetical protein